MLHAFIVRTAFRIPILFNFPALIGKVADGQKVRLHIWNLTASARSFINDTCFKGAYVIKINFPALIGKVADGQKVRLHILGAPALQKRDAPAFPEIQPEPAAAHLQLVAVMLHDMIPTGCSTGGPG